MVSGAEAGKTEAGVSAAMRKGRGGGTWDRGARDAGGGDWLGGDGTGTGGD